MPLLEFLYQSLASFRHIFPRHRSYAIFCGVLLGFIGAGQMTGISSLCRLWQLGEPGYHRLLHFFHSTGWCAGALAVCWQDLLLSHSVAVQISGRTVLQGDHTYAPKDGVRMPGVVALHQDSETASRPSYFRGHHWGALGVLCGCAGRELCVPLQGAIHQGFAHLRQPQAGEGEKETLATRLVAMAVQLAVRREMPSLLVLDAFFSIASVFSLAESVWSTRLKQPYLYVITRAKRSYVAYRKAEQPASKGPGRPAKYGDKIKLTEVFETHRDKFKKRACLIYGRIEEISYYSLNLLWKPLGREIRFIFAVTSRGSIVLMSNSLHIHPTTAIALYCRRIRIETMFWVLKHVIGAFCYRFWSKALPRHSRRPKKNSELLAPPSDRLTTVAACWEACERFVTVAFIALGLLQLLALKFPTGVWERFDSFLRTRSRSAPSERTVKEVVARELLADFHNPAPSATMRQLQTALAPDPGPLQDERATA